MATNPMSQFEVYRIGPEIKVGAFDISFTNASLFMVLSTLAILIIFNLGSKKNSLVPSKLQLITELSYNFVAKMIGDKSEFKKALKEPFANLASIEKAKKLLDWEPQIDLKSWISKYKNE